jgi:hypothetical protein
MGFERNYQIKIPSNQIIQRQFYSIKGGATNLDINSNKPIQQLDP